LVALVRCLCFLLSLLLTLSISLQASHHIVVRPVKDAIHINVKHNGTVLDDIFVGMTSKHEFQEAGDTEYVLVDVAANKQAANIIIPTDYPREAIAFTIDQHGSCNLTQCPHDASIILTTPSTIEFTDSLRARQLTLDAASIINKTTLAVDTINLSSPNNPHDATTFLNTAAGTIHCKTFTGGGKEFRNDGTFTVQDEMHCNAKTWHNHGHIHIDAQVSCRGDEWYNDGVIDGTAQLVIDCSTRIINQKTITVDGDCTIACSKEFTNNGNVTTHSNCTINANHATNVGTITTLKELKIGGHRFAQQGEVRVEGNATFTTEHITNDKTLNVNGTLSITHTNGTFENHENGIIQVGNTGQFMLPGGTFKNNLGSLWIHGDIKIKANTFVSDGPVAVKVDGESIDNTLPMGGIRKRRSFCDDKCQRKCEKRIHERIHKGEICSECQGTYLQHNNKPALIISQSGSIDLEVNHATNKDGSYILASNNISIKASDLTNRSTAQKVTQCTENLYEKNSRTRFECLYYCPADASASLPAGIVAGDSITVTLGKQSITTRGELKQHMHKLTNNGFIGARQNISVSSTDGVSKVINGLREQSFIAVPPYKAELVPLFKSSIDTQLAVRAQNEFYVWDHIAEHALVDSKALRALAPWQYRPIIATSIPLLTAPVDTRGLPSIPYRFVASPTLESVILPHLILSQTGFPLIPGTYTPEEQYNVLYENGLYYVLINGHLFDRETNVMRLDAPPSTAHKETKNDLVTENSEFDQTLNELLSRYCIQPCQITLENLKDRLELLRNEKHIISITPDIAKKSPFSMLAYELVNGIASPEVLISEADYNANMRLGSTFQAYNLIFNVDEVVNFGRLIAFNTIHIKAKSITNAASTKRLLQITTPTDSGQIIGFEIEIEADTNELTNGSNSGIANAGGFIFAEHRVSLIAHHGDVENLPANARRIALGNHRHAWRRSEWNESCHQGEASIDLESGNIVSGGTIDIVAHAGRIINQASHIIGRGKVNLQSYHDMISEGLLTKKVSKKKTSTFFSVAMLIEETVTPHAATIESTEGNVIIESTTGSTDFKGTRVTAGDNIIITAAVDNKGSAPSATSHRLEKEHELGFLGWYSRSRKTNHEHVLANEFIAGNQIKLNAGKDNVLQAVIMNADKLIHLVAQRDTIINNKKIKSSDDVASWSIGISTLGIDMLKPAKDGAFGDALWVLPKSDPLIGALHNLVLASDTADRVAEGTMVGAQLLAKLSAYGAAVGQVQTSGLTQLIGERSIGDVFMPEVAIRIGTESMNIKRSTSAGSKLTSRNVVIETGRDLDSIGTEFDTSQLILHVRRKLKIEAGHSTVEMHNSQHGVYAGVGADTFFFGADSFTETSRSVTYDIQHLKTDFIEVVTGDDGTFRGIYIDTKDGFFDIGRHLNLELMQDTYESSSLGLSGRLSTSGAFAAHVGVSHAVKKWAAIQQGLAAHDLYLKAGFNIRLLGTCLLARTNSSSIEAQKIQGTHVHDIHQETSGSFGISTLPSGSETGLYGFIDADYRSLNREQINRATVDVANVHAEVNPKINRNRERMRELLRDDSSHYRLVIPIADIKKMSENIGKLATPSLSEADRQNIELENMQLASRSQILEPVEMSADDSNIEESKTLSGVYDPTHFVFSIPSEDPNKEIIIVAIKKEVEGFKVPYYTYTPLTFSKSNPHSLDIKAMILTALGATPEKMISMQAMRNSIIVDPNVSSFATRNELENFLHNEVSGVIARPIAGLFVFLSGRNMQELSKQAHEELITKIKQSYPVQVATGLLERVYDVVSLSYPILARMAAADLEGMDEWCSLYLRSKDSEDFQRLMKEQDRMIAHLHKDANDATNLLIEGLGSLGYYIGTLDAIGDSNEMLDQMRMHHLFDARSDPGELVIKEQAIADLQNQIGRLVNPLIDSIEQMSGPERARLMVRILGPTLIARTAEKVAKLGNLANVASKIDISTMVGTVLQDAGAEMEVAAAQGGKFSFFSKLDDGLGGGGIDGGSHVPRCPPLSTCPLTKIFEEHYNRIKNQIPADWISKPAKGSGFKFTNPLNSHDSVRIMPANPTSPMLGQQRPYVVRRKNGKVLDVMGKEVSSIKTLEAHIKIQDFIFKP